MELLAKKINIAFIVATLLFTSVAVFGVAGSVEGQDDSSSGNGVATTGDANGEECDSFRICNPLESESLEDLLNRILEYLIFIAGSLTVTTIVLGGILYIVSGVSDNTAKARKMIQYSIGGLVLVLLARGIVSLVTILF